MIDKAKLDEWRRLVGKAGFIIEGEAGFWELWRTDEDGNLTERVAKELTLDDARMFATALLALLDENAELRKQLGQEQMRHITAKAERDALIEYTQPQDCGHPRWFRMTATSTGEMVCTVCAAERKAAKYRAALIKIRDTAKSWEGRKEAPYWNLGDIAAAVLVEVNIDDVINAVCCLVAKYGDKWREKPDSYWLARLMQEVGELASALVDDHPHTPDWELTQIASICINWLDMRQRVAALSGEKGGAA